MTPHKTGSTTTPGAPRAAAPLTRTFGSQGPTLGDLSDAYLQDYQVAAVPVPQHRPRPGCPSHRVLRPRRAGHRADHAPDPPVPTRPARRRGGHRHHQPGDLGPPPHGHLRRPLGLARHRALTAAFGAQYGGFATDWSPVSWGSLDELFVNLTMPCADRGSTPPRPGVMW